MFTLIPQLFYPLLAVLISGCVGAAAVLIVSLKCRRALLVTKCVAGCVTVGAVIATIVIYARYYQGVIAPSGDYEGVSTLWMSVSVAVLLLVLCALTLFVGKKRPETNNTRAIVYAAISVALAFALSYARLFKLPQGGSVTFASMLPILVYSYMFGVRRGVPVAFVYGVLQAIQDPFIIHPMQFMLDYPLAFAMIGLGGLFREIGFVKKYPVVGFVLGGVVAVLLRYACHILSGIFAFESYVGAGYTTVAWGFLYNSFVLVDMAIALVAGCALFVSRQFVKQMESVACSSSAKEKRPLPVAEDAVLAMDKVAGEVADEDTGEDNSAVSDFAVDDDKHLALDDSHAEDGSGGDV